MALALYRKYRPRTFAEVIGQEHVTEPLSQALRSGRLHHAYLFSGPRGCGKTSSARILARSLNCEQGPTPDPCGVCASCRSLANDGSGSIDVIEIDAASHGGVDDARDLREKAFFAPASSRYKIYVIDEAHMVSSAGFNALLKLVEEPPDYVKFIFATTEPEKVLGTIRSRTHHYPFRLIPPAVLRPYLQQLTEAEGISVEPTVFPLVVRAGGGSARDTLSVLDQLIAGAGPEGVSYARAVSLLGVTDTALIDEMCDAIAAGDGGAAYTTIDRVAEAGHDARRFASDLLERFRDLIVLQQVPDAVTKGLIDGPADQLDAMSAQATRLGPATLSRCADIVHNGLVEMRGTTAPRLLLELITARMLLPGADDTTGALLQRLERMERRLTLSGDNDLPPAVRPQPEPVDAGGGQVGGVGISAARAAAAAAGRRGSGGGGPANAAPQASRGPSDASGGAAEVRPAESGSPAAEVSPRPVSSDGSAVSRAPGDDGSAVSRAPGDDGSAASRAPGDDGSAASRAPGGDRSAASQAPDVAADMPAVARPSQAAPRPVAQEEDLEEPPPWDVDEEPEPPRDEPRYAAASTSRPEPVAPAQAQARPQAPARAAEPAAAEPAPPQARRPEPAGLMPDAPVDPVPASAGVPGQLDAAAIREVWPEIIGAVGRQSKKLAALASGATVRDLDGRTVVLTFRFPAHAKMVAAAPDLLTDALYEALGDRWQIRCEVAGEQGGTQPPARSAAPQPGAAPAQQVAGGSGPVPNGSARAQNAVRSAGATTGPGRQREAAAPSPAQSSGDDDDWPEPARPGGATAVHGKDAEDEEWPGTAIPGGGSPGAGVGPESRSGDAGIVSATGENRADRDGQSEAGGGRQFAAAPHPDTSARSASGGAANAVGTAARSAPGGAANDAGAANDVGAAARSASSTAAGNGPGTVPDNGPLSPSNPSAAARGLAAARAAAAAAGKGQPKPRPTDWSDGSPTEEAPYDPDFDGPIRPAAKGGYDGFDPGDEPLDDVIDEKTARRSTEQQAMQLLQEAFGAEKIGES